MFLSKGSNEYSFQFNNRSNEHSFGNERIFEYSNIRYIRFSPIKNHFFIQEVKGQIGNAGTRIVSKICMLIAIRTTNTIIVGPKSHVR